MLESAGFAEKQIGHVALQLDVLDALKPYQFALMGSIIEGRAESLRLTDTDSVPFGHGTDDLDVGVLVVKFGNLVESASVDVFVRHLAQHVHRCADAQF